MNAKGGERPFLDLGPLKGLVYICGIWVGGMSETIVTGLHLSYSDLVNFIA